MNTEKQAMIHSVGAVVLLFSQWLIFVFLVRIDGYESAGIFSLAMSIANVFSVIAGYNMRSFRITDTNSKYLQSQYLTAAIIPIIVSIVLCVLYITCADGYTNDERICILLYLLFYDSSCVADVLYSYVQIKGGLEYNGYSSFARGIVALFSFSIVFLPTKNLPISIGIMAASNVTVLVIYDIKIYKKITGEQIVISFDGFDKVAEILRQCFPLMLASLLSNTVTAISRRVIQNQLGVKMLGYFSSIFTVTVLITTVAPLVINAFLPWFATIWNNHKRSEILRAIVLLYVFVIAFCVLAMLAVMIAGKYVLKIVFGDEILEYFNLLYWSIAVSGIYAINVIESGLLTAMRHINGIIISTVADLIITLSLSKTFVSAFGIYGGAYALICAHTVQMLVLLIFMLRKINRTHID